MKKFHIIPVSRARDDQLLEMINRRVSGEAVINIAQQIGVKPAAITVATNAVRKADKSESGENVAGSYW